MSPKKIMIDPGHYPGSDNKGLYGYSEETFNWATAIALQASLRKRGFTAELTRTRNQQIGVTQRGEMAKGYDMFISLHTNASSNPDRRGVSIYFSLMQPENQNRAITLSSRIAKAMGIPSQGAKTWKSSNYPTRYDYHGVLYGSAQKAKCPICFLVESGYHTNPEDVTKLLTNGMNVVVAEAQSEYICAVFNVPYKLTTEIPKEEVIPMEKIKVDFGNILSTSGFVHEGTSYIPARVILNALRVKFEWLGVLGGLYIHPPIVVTAETELLQLTEMKAALKTYLQLKNEIEKAKELLEFIIVDDN